jgi:hypothetical protein
MSNNKQQTTVEQFAISLYEGGYLQGNGDEIQNLLEQHLEIEKEQHANTWGNALSAITVDKWESFEQYYNETYGGNK